MPAEAVDEKLPRLILIKIRNIIVDRNILQTWNDMAIPCSEGRSSISFLMEKPNATISVLGDCC